MRCCDRVVLLGLAATAIVVYCLRIDTSALPEVGRFRDDAYYFFSWARSLASGDGPCVTPGVATNGVQLLWGLVLAMCAMVFGSAPLPEVAHMLGLAAHVLTACVLGLSLRERGAAAWCGALLYAANPFLLTEAQNGQETALACLAAAALLATHRGSDRIFLAAALLAPLARADLFMLVPFLAWHRYGWSMRLWLVPGASLAAYLGANWIVAGRLLQDSAVPIPWLFEQHFLATDPSFGDHSSRLWWWLRPCLLGGPWGHVSPWLAGVLVFVAGRHFLRGGLRFLPLLMTACAWSLGAEDLEVPLVASVLFAVVSRDGFERQELPFLALVLGWSAVLFVHHVLRHYPRHYYFAPMGVAVVAAMIVFQARRPRLGSVLVVVVAALQLMAALRPPPTRGWQEESRMAGRFLREFVAVQEPVGCFNAGLVGYLDDGPIVNLDGVVNRAAFEALRRGDLNGYLDQRGVRFVLDMPVQFAVRDAWQHASGRHFGPGFDPSADLQEVARFDVPGVEGDAPGTDALRLYWRKGAGERPAYAGDSRVMGRAPGGGSYVLWAGDTGETLVCAAPDGEQTHLAMGEAGVAIVVRVSTPEPGRYILHEGDLSRPVLVLENP